MKVTPARVRIAGILLGVMILSGSAAEEMLAVLVGLSIILLGARFGGEIARRFGQPPVLGELAGGMVLGNLDLVGFTGLEAIATNPHIDILAQLGVLLLLFEVGLESTVGQMLKTGVSALLVALIGILIPLGLGYAASAILLTESTWHTHLFVGATLTATSVGITARVMADLGRSTTLESRIILGAAVIDDVLGLVVLSVVVGAVAASNVGGSLSLRDGVLTLAQASAFLVGAIVIGVFLVPRLFSLSAKVNSAGMLFSMSLVFCFLLSWSAGLIGLAPIIGAFAAGLVLEDVHFRDFTDGGQKELEQLIHPLVAFLAPVFFVVMGMKTDLRYLGDMSVVALAAALLVVAVVGKIAAGAGAIERDLDRLTIGIGMIPRGEVGLIFVVQGAGLVAGGNMVIPPSLYSALVIVVMTTTVITPPLLRWRSGKMDPAP